MRMDAVLGGMALGVVAAAGLVGCAGEEDPIPAPAFPEGTGQPAANAARYPAGPYGINPGRVIANYQFIGYANADENNDTMQPIQLADFYNPTGTEVFPEGSQYGAGEPKPKVLLIDVSSVWCGPCKIEAESVLPRLYDKYQPLGGEFLMQLADGRNPGEPAVPLDLRRWTTQYEVKYPSAIDPSYKLGALFQADAFPANMIVRTEDMTIIEVVSGVPAEDSNFWRTFERVMNGQL
ncbi:TlpA family protein disulfide reductase [Sorangium sp. So ce854]|uniref:TlpA family protein disulfide reductase n=1 Tax=Sorangium sp. So ce854 TaxID=3133322 RepID=UPI000B20C374